MMPKFFTAMSRSSFRLKTALGPPGAASDLRLRPPRTIIAIAASATAIAVSESSARAIPGHPSRRPVAGGGGRSVPISRQDGGPVSLLQPLMSGLLVFSHGSRLCASLPSCLRVVRCLLAVEGEGRNVVECLRCIARA